MTGANEIPGSQKVDVREFIEKKPWLLHIETGTAGRAKALHEGTYVSKINQKTIDGDVVELETGDAFMLRDGAFAVLSEAEAGLYVGSARSMAALLLELFKTAAVQGIPVENAMLVIKAALRRQISTIDKGA